MTIIPNGGSEGQRSQDIGGAARSTQPARPKAAASNARPGSAASALHLSASAEHFMSLRARLDGLDIARPERVERLRQLIAAGRYRPDSAATAAAMLDDPATAAALGLS